MTARAPRACLVLSLVLLASCAVSAVPRKKAGQEPPLEPVIGVLTAPLSFLPVARARRGRSRPSLAQAASSFPSSYARWLEQAGARVVPILYDSSPAALARQFGQINGVLFTGGCPWQPYTMRRNGPWVRGVSICHAEVSRQTRLVRSPPSRVTTLLRRTVQAASLGRAASSTQATSAQPRGCSTLWRGPTRRARPCRCGARASVRRMGNAAHAVRAPTTARLVWQCVEHAAKPKNRRSDAESLLPKSAVFGGTRGNAAHAVRAAVWFS